MISSRRMKGASPTRSRYRADEVGSATARLGRILVDSGRLPRRVRDFARPLPET
jgi:hypothetical protein